MLDAPVSGGLSGNLVLWVGGDKEAFERYESVLPSFASAEVRGSNRAAP
jgi:3-hydroxyisobutyrate dehydrogenase-like beta-hydroxyacid dehydrogenase